MTYRIFRCENFVNFIQNSRIKLENSLSGLDILERKEEILNKFSSIEQRIINNVNILTQEDKIVWFKDSSSLLKGVVLENCTFSDYRILIKKEFLSPEEVLKHKVGYLSEKYKIFFLKGILAFEKYEYITNSDYYKNDSMNTLIDAIEKRLVQQSN